MSTATYTVTGMTCGHCVNAVTTELSSIAGVTAVDVDLDTGRATVTSDEPLVVALNTDDMGGDVDDEIDDAIENQDQLPADRLEFVKFGSTGPLPMGDVLYIGSMDGTALYATRADIGDLLPELERRLTGTRDLDEVLDDEEFADRFVNEIETFYLAVEPGSADCVFQPVSSTRVVRRTNG